ncbi:MAG TPA: phosphotransferase [Streptosporangiaceae bacterium]
MAVAAEVTEALGAWSCPVASITTLGGGWNSSTWLVTTRDDQRFVAKLVDHLDADALTGGLQVAEFAAERGLTCGAPLRTADGRLTVGLRSGVLTLLRHVPGTPPDLRAADHVRRAGQVLGRAHQILGDYPPGDEPRYHWPWEWISTCLETVPMAPDLKGAAWRAWDQIVAMVDRHQLRVSLIHGDPGPDSFLLSGRDSGPDALIDWATTLRGPLLYDLASFAVLSREAGPRPIRWLAEGYAEVGPQISTELRHLDSLLRLRWIAQAIWFASRIERGIDRGPGATTANEDGLAAAYQGIIGRE